jgi:predicted DNA-binding transcriptional regulator AlpA
LANNFGQKLDIKAQIVMPKLSKTALSLPEVAQLSGLSQITILRAVSIARGNRTSFGRARMPGLKSSRVGWKNTLQFKPSDVQQWLKARTQFNRIGFKKKERRPSSRKSHRPETRAQAVAQMEQWK